MAEKKPTTTRKKAPAKKTAKSASVTTGEITARGEAPASPDKDKIQTLKADLDRLLDHGGQFTHQTSELIQQKRKELAKLES